MKRRVIRRRFARKASIPTNVLHGLSDLADELQQLVNDFQMKAGELEGAWQEIQQEYNTGDLDETSSDAIFQIGRYSRFLNQEAKDAVSHIGAVVENVDKIQ
jgi:hypothetical protein